MTFINVKDNINVVADGVSDDTAALIFYPNQTLEFDGNACVPIRIVRPYTDRQ